MKKQRKTQDASVENQATVAIPATEPAENTGSGTADAPAALSENGAGESLPATDVEPDSASCDGTTPAPDDNAGGNDCTPDFREQLRQAYLRGRNEAIEALMQQPGMMQPLAPPARSAPPAPEPEVMILNNPRTSIWDK